MATEPKATITGRINNREPDLANLPAITNAKTETTADPLFADLDLSGIEAFAAALERAGSVADDMAHSVGYLKYIQDRYHQDREPIPLTDGGSIYTTHFNESAPRPRVQDRAFDKALSKRRAANKRARKARRK